MSRASSGRQPLVKRDRVFEFLIPRYVEDLDLSHGTALYLEDISVNFDGLVAPGLGNE